MIDDIEARDRAARRCSSPGSACRATSSSSARRQRARREHVRQGAPRDRRGRSRLRLRDRAGHRSRRPHRARRDDAARAADRRRGRRPRAGRRGRRASSTAAGSRPRSRSAPTACGSAPASSRRPRRARSPGYKDALLRTAEDGTVISRAFTGKTLRGGAQRAGRSTIEEHPEELATVPRADGQGGRGKARCTSGRRDAPTSTPTRSATRRARASARSTRSSPRATSCGGSSTRPRPDRVARRLRAQTPHDRVVV